MSRSRDFYRGSAPGQGPLLDTGAGRRNRTRRARTLLPPTAPVTGAPDARPPQAASRRSVASAVGVLLAVCLFAAATLVHLPFAILSPGPITNVLGQDKGTGETPTDRIKVTGRPTYPTSGSLDFTTVRVNGGPGYPVNAWEVLLAWVNPTEEVYPVDQIFAPQRTAAEVAQENQAEMRDSQQEAEAVALRALGYEVRQRIKVGRVASGAPSEGTLQVGDYLRSVGGAPVTDAGSVRAALQKVTPGETVAIGVERAGSEVLLTSRTGRSADGRTVLGIVLAVDFSFPFTVAIDAGNVGGPSAGMMFSLGIYDKLTEGAMTGGRDIAGTGTIDASGGVGPIGGIRQKMAGAQQGGATFFLAPAGNCDEVRGREPKGLQVFRVATFDDARMAVEGIGRGDTAALPHC